MYSEFTVIIDGALDDVVTFGDGPENAVAMVDLIEDLEQHAANADQCVEVYVLTHDHALLADGDDELVSECGCAQFALDHTPSYAFNVEARVSV